MSAAHEPGYDRQLDACSSDEETQDGWDRLVTGTMLNAAVLDEIDQASESRGMPPSKREALARRIARMLLSRGWVQS